jgi:hypothetical protein
MEKKEWSATDKKNLMEQIHQMEKYEQIEIFRILQKDMVKFTENQNGIFINIQHVKQDTLFKMYEFVQYALKQRSILEERNKMVEQERISTIVEPLPTEITPSVVETPSLSSTEQSIQQPVDQDETTDLNQQPVKFTGVKAKILKNYKDANKKKNNRNKDK